MHPVRTLLLVIHVASAAVIFGASLGIVRNLKRTLPLGQQSFRIAAEDGARRQMVISLSSVLTLATGLALIFTMGGFGVVPLNIHLALGLMLLAMVLRAVLVRPSSVKLVLIAKSESVDKEAAAKWIKRMAMGEGIQHLLWLTILTLMFYRIAKG